MKAVEIHNIYKSYKEVKALSGINLQVKKGELFGLIGPDGAGKTSLIRILATLLYPDEGQASIFGWDTIDEFREIRKIAGYMPGRFSLYQDLSVEENLNFYASIFGTTIKENYHLIKDIYQQIEPFKKRLAGRLSGGMKQKLALSCALIHKPDILFLDEPTTGVDAVSRKEFWEILKSLEQVGITIIVSTPYMDEAELCDRVALMQQGRLLDVDTPANIIGKYDHDLYAVESKTLHRLIKDLRTFDKTTSAFPFGDTVHLATNETFRRQELDKFLSGKGHENITIKPIEPGIEDCFMNLMRRQNDQ
ncbi:MAG: ABC transporter ATP-binding protein [Bacteroidales bacterium]|nr:ABC transporter ATP-binding protein [Bacteroidales bacterium]MCF8328528.1 ABC transporter ATP-binding protein [Bacteroidales bacterium]